MALWFLRGLRRGVVTTRYPAEPPEPWTATLPRPPMFRPGNLTLELASALVTECPSRALTIENDRTLRYDLGACTACGRCRESAEAAGHAGAVIAPGRDFELAATDRGQLVKHIPLAGRPDDRHQ